MVASWIWIDNQVDNSIIYYIILKFNGIIFSQDLIKLRVEALSKNIDQLIVKVLFKNDSFFWETAPLKANVSFSKVRELSDLAPAWSLNNWNCGNLPF